MKAWVSSAVALLFLAACGGGGGGGGSTPGGGGGGPLPPTFANTSSPYYMPQANGNRWTFASGGAFADRGKFTLSCSCAISGRQLEEIDVLDTTGAYGGEFYFWKTTSGSSMLDEWMGVSSNHGVSITLVTDGLGHYGIPVNDSNATAGENWSFGGGNSTITSVNGTQPYGTSAIQSINSDTVSAPGASSIGWAFARGVGFTSITSSGQTTAITTFSINVSSSTSVERSPRTVKPVSVEMVGQTDGVAQLGRLLNTAL